MVTECREERGQAGQGRPHRPGAETGKPLFAQAAKEGLGHLFNARCWQGGLGKSEKKSKHQKKGTETPVLVPRVGLGSVSHQKVPPYSTITLFWRHRGWGRLGGGAGGGGIRRDKHIAPLAWSSLETHFAIC